jgi:hypothetical protein
LRTEALIEQLSANLVPVRPMRPPAGQALLWVGFAVAAIALAVAVEGLRRDIVMRMLMPYEVAQWLASVATGVTAAVAAAMLARPDRASSWVWLPVPFMILWVGSLGWGCLEDLVRLGARAMEPETSWSCVRFTMGLGTPLAVVLVLLLRHAGPIRPGPVLGFAGLASAALCSAGLSLFHHLDASLEVLIWHGLAIAALSVLAPLLGRPLLLPAPNSP